MDGMNLTGANMAKHSTMVGLPQRPTAKRVEHRQETHVRDTPTEQKQQRSVQKDTFTRQTSPDQDQPKTHRRKVQNIMTNYVASTGKKTGASEAQKKDHVEAKKQEHAREKEEAQTAAKTPLDNAARIGLMYKAKTRQQAHGVNRRSVGEEQQQPQAQQQRLKSFLNNLKEYVQLEYKQYGTQENSLYSRRNLREILSALGHETKAFDNKAKKDRMNRTTGTSEVKSYNKHYETRARGNLKMYQDDLMREQHDPFEMIA